MMWYLAEDDRALSGGRHVDSLYAKIDSGVCFYKIYINIDMDGIFMFNTKIN